MIDKVKLKVCGIESISMAQACVDAGVHYLGVVFCPDSKRCVTPLFVAYLIQQFKHAAVTVVGVFTHHTAKDIVRICRQTQLTHVQLHGVNARKAMHQLPDSLSRILVIDVDEEGKVDDEALGGLPQLRPQKEYVLFDAKKRGTGHTVPIEKVQGVAGSFRFFLAGGLHAENIEDTLKGCAAYAVDVSSGVRTSSGVFSVQRVKQLSQIVKKGGAHAFDDVR